MTVRLAPSADGLYYLLEVSIAKEVLDVWQQCEIVLPRRTRHAGRSSTTPYMTHKSHSLPGTSMAKELGRAFQSASASEAPPATSLTWRFVGSIGLIAFASAAPEVPGSASIEITS